MRRRVSRSLSAVAAAVLLAGCGDSGEETTTATTTTQIIQGVGSTDPIEVDAGTSFAIDLEANNTTPYHWVFTQKPDSSVVSYEGRKYETDPGSEGLVGAGGTETFTFDAVAAGTTEIGLAYEEISGDGPTTDKIDRKVVVR